MIISSMLKNARNNNVKTFSTFAFYDLWLLIREETSEVSIELYPVPFNEKLSF